MDTSQVSGGAAVVQALVELGVRHVFGVASIHNLPIVDALHRSDEIRLIEMRHEQSAVHAADGYARAAGRLGVALASTGPGTANTMGGLFEARVASSPVLLLTGQVDTGAYGKGRGALHEADNQVAMLRTLCRRVTSVRARSELASAVLDTAADVLTGRHQPGAVEIPIDLQHAFGPPAPRWVPPDAAAGPDEAALARAATLIESARRPLLWAGGGVIAAGATAELTALAEQLGAPVVTTIEGRGAMPETHPLCLGPTSDFVSMQPVIEAADVVLVVGTRFQTASARSRAMAIPGSLIHLDVDPSMIGLVHRPAVALWADARVGLAALRAALGPGDTDPAFLADARASRNRAEAEGRAAMGPDQEAILAAIRHTLPSDSPVVKDVTVAALVWANRWLTVDQPRTTMRPVSVGIGMGLALAIGAAVGSERPTVVVQGDGGLALGVGELASAVQQRLPLIVCVFNDRGYGILRWAQDQFFGGRRAGVDLVTPRLMTLAESFGMRSAAVSSAEEFALAFDRAVRVGGPWLIDIDLSCLHPMQIRAQP